MKITTYQVNAFATNSPGGNPAGVVLDADSFSKEQKQAIAKQVGFSETAFVMQSDVADFRVEFFTPNSQIDLCGHATIATFSFLRSFDKIQAGSTYTMDTLAGILSLEITKDTVFMDQNCPQYGEILSFESVKQCFTNFSQSDLHPTLPIQIVSTGLQEIFIPMKNRAALFALELNFDAMAEINKQYNTIGTHVFCFDVVDLTAIAHSRNFCPLYDISEESATGTSSGALSCYLWNHKKIDATNPQPYLLEQGYSMSLPSQIYSRIENTEERITRIQVGGSAYVVNEIEVVL